MSALPRIASVAPGDPLPEREFHPDEIQLFLYNAALWNAHRIHFDHPYATGVEDHPGLVVPGPLLGDWLTQCALEWCGDEGRLASFEYSNRRLCYAGERLRSTGRVVSVDRASAEVTLELAIVNDAGDVAAPGSAVVRFGR